jgi:hypothetical protein
MKKFIPVYRNTLKTKVKKHTVWRESGDSIYKVLEYYRENVPFNMTSRKKTDN